MAYESPIVGIIGKDSFKWLSKDFCKETKLKDIPGEILERIAAVDTTIRDYTNDKNTITCIAVITFSYNMTDKIQQARFGPKDMLLLKVLAKREKSRREGREDNQDSRRDAPLFELITGPVGDRIRETGTINSPI